MEDNSIIKRAYHHDLKEKGMVLKLDLYHTAHWGTSNGFVGGEIHLFDLTSYDCCLIIEAIAEYRTNLLSKLASQAMAERLTENQVGKGSWPWGLTKR